MAKLELCVAGAGDQQTHKVCQCAIKAFSHHVVWLPIAILPLLPQLLFPDLGTYSILKYDIATNATDVILNQSNQAISGGVLNLVDYQFVPHDENNV